ncbi:hypothetical protein JKF63_00806 [Porcisia hertigi]|uniref:Uncharacterized protein n=1 Tax=Porcisia hertigi TaxID=2761500 RepID=A0A836KXI1_9TRYP|nr:hypothetical protein JKF63_00806 [Porcisia hertigi]
MYTTEEQCVPAKRMTDEELQRSADRLSTIYRPEVELKPLVPRLTITQEALKRHIRHLYDDSLERQQRAREDVARQVDTTIKSSTISPSEETALVRHLYDESLALQKENFDRLYARETSHYERSTRRLKAKEQQATTDRLYREGMQRERKKHIALYEKYVTGRHQPTVQRTKAELEASADKMTRGEGVTS